MRLPFVILLSSCALLLAGCAGMPAITTTNTDSIPGTALRGSVHGGQNPIAGAHVYLYAINTIGYGGPGIAATSANASVSLLHSGTGTTQDGSGHYYVTTDPYGNFTITGDYSCPSSYPNTYFYASGGDPGLGSGVNSAIALTAPARPATLPLPPISTKSRPSPPPTPTPATPATRCTFPLPTPMLAATGLTNAANTSLILKSPHSVRLPQPPAATVPCPKTRSTPSLTSLQPASTPPAPLQRSAARSSPTPLITASMLLTRQPPHSTSPTIPAPAPPSSATCLAFRPPHRPSSQCLPRQMTSPSPSATPAAG